MRILHTALIVATLLATTVAGLAGNEILTNHITGAESGGNYAIFNTSGTTRAMGRYQFLPSTFAGLGYMKYTGGKVREWSSYTFTDEARAAGVNSLNDLRYSEAGHRLQDAGFVRFTNRNLNSFSATTRNAIGSTVVGRPVTTDGLLSTAHFLGSGGLNRWAASGFTAAGLPPGVVAANGGSAAKLNQYLLNRMGNHAGETWVGGEEVDWAGGEGDSGRTTNYAQDGMYDETEGFPGFGSKRQVVIQETLPFQGDRKSLGGGA
ncbi:hypothetical protein [Aureimonas sp. AU12]|uniref:hypothetical protein n=1 Tax=Aureimonas sp. AU12 TaxID=1638161 RepID=UPI0007821802|nr:hypothetical protein [Aureimonas sp. AU12]